jgi:hypothetical protein
MKMFQKSAAVFSLVCGLAFATPVPTVATGTGWFQEGAGQNLRSVIDRTQTDLQAAAQLEQKPKEHERYRRAQTALSNFDRKLSKGHFDKDKLKDAIGAIESVLDHNTLQASMRDALKADLADLHAARDVREH